MILCKGAVVRIEDSFGEYRALCGIVNTDAWHRSIFAVFTPAPVICREQADSTALCTGSRNGQSRKAKTIEILY